MKFAKKREGNVCDMIAYGCIFTEDKEQVQKELQKYFTRHNHIW